MYTDLDLEDSSTSIDLEEIESMRKKIEQKQKCIRCLYFLGIFLFVITVISLFALIIMFFSSTHSSIKILSWNLQSFGTKKLNDPIKMKEINKILYDYDVILLNELEQSECDTNEFCEMKVYFQQNYPEYHFMMSPSLGRRNDNRGKEQYGFLIKKQFNFQLYHYADPNNIFARPPYYIYIKEYNVYLGNLHTTPGEISEVYELVNFFESVKGDMVLMGDLNVCNPSTLNGEFVKDSFNWILNDNQNTNMNLNCAYDRILSSKSFQRYKNPNVLVNQNIPEFLLSDHYPIVLDVY